MERADNVMNSWLRNPRPETRGKEEARQAQGEEDAGLGQAVVDMLTF